MKLYTGGAWQGQDVLARQENPEGPFFEDFHETVRRAVLSEGQDPRVFAEDFCAAHPDAIVIANEGHEDHKFYEGDLVILNIIPEEGYILDEITLDGINQAVIIDEDRDNAQFTMPKDDVTVIATFKEMPSEGFENIDASTKAVKFFVNGKLLIKRGDKVFDAKGQIVE